MGHIHVTAYHHGFLFVQPAQIVREGVLPGHAVLQTGQPALAIGRVDGDQKEPVKFQRNHAALVVVLLHANAHLHRQRLLSGENRSAGIALLFRAVPVLRVPLGRKVGLAGLHLGFLQAKRVRAAGGKIVCESLGQAGAQAVDIP